MNFHEYFTECNIKQQTKKAMCHLLFSEAKALARRFEDDSQQAPSEQCENRSEDMRFSVTERE
jgi:hypothetical protein